MNPVPFRLIASLILFTGVTRAQEPASAQKPAEAAKLPASFAVKVVGHGKPMVLIPGLTCGADVWNGTVDHFKERYECHLLTLAGFAGQPAISAPMLETIRKDIAAYIRGK